MDAGLAGQMPVIYWSQSGVMLSATHSLFGYNMTGTNISSLVAPLIAKIRAQGYKTKGSIAIDLSTPTEFANFTSLFHAINPESTTGSAGIASLMSSRLLGLKQLTDISQDQLVGYLQRALKSHSGSGGLMIFGMQGGKGPASVPAEMRGALNPSWRTAYPHAITMGASVNTTADPQTSLNSAAKWVNENEETMWHDWTPEIGSYMNEANPFNPDFKKDHYGSSYDRLAAIKKQYDPTESSSKFHQVKLNYLDFSPSKIDATRVI